MTYNFSIRYYVDLEDVSFVLAHTPCSARATEYSRLLFAAKQRSIVWC